MDPLGGDSFNLWWLPQDPIRTGCSACYALTGVVQAVGTWANKT